MPNLCMIGNSHIAAMLHAWKDMRPHQEDLRCDFFAQRANAFVEAELLEGSLQLPESKPLRYLSDDEDSKRKSAIDIGSYGAFVIVGLGFGPISVLRTYRNYHYHGLKGFRGQIISRDLFKRAVLREAAEGAALHVASLIRKITDKPVLMAATPLPSESGYLDQDAPGMTLWRNAVNQGDAGHLMQIYAEVCAEIQKLEITVIGQPEETIATPVSTLKKFSDGSVRIVIEKNRPDNDYMHMNPAYGQVVWRDVLKTLNHTTVQAP